METFNFVVPDPVRKLENSQFFLISNRILHFFPPH